MVTKQIRLAIIEDHMLFARALESWLGQQKDCVLVGCAEDGAAGWDLCVAKHPDLALMDIELPILDGLELAQRLLAKLPATRILAVTGQHDPYTIWRVWHS